MTCVHKEIIMVNAIGRKLESGGHEVDFVIRCHICDEELFRMGEYRKIIHNYSKH